MRLRSLICLLCVVMLLPIEALGAEWICFPVKNPTPDTGFLVNDYTGDVTITFLGDCTLGGESPSAIKYNGYVQTINRNGLEYPFRHLLDITGKDDLTIANLEGVLTDRNLKKEDKTFNFAGPTSFAGILTAGSIDCVTLANNHTYDYGREGYADTKTALTKEGTAFFGSDCLAIWDWDGLMIGFVGVTGGNQAALSGNVQLLWDMGCCAVIAFMHAGREGSGDIIERQRSIAREAASLGCSLLIGSHPHVVQGYEEVNGMPVVYSLGNCSFGGNHNPDDKDALAVQAVLHFEEGVPAGVELHLYPISVSGTYERNDFSPVLLTGARAERVLQKMEASTGWELPEFDPETGTVIRCGEK